MEQIIKLKAGIASEDFKLTELNAEGHALRNAIAETNRAVKRADEVLCGPYDFTAHMNAQSARQAARHRQAELAAQLNSLNLTINTVSMRLSQMRRELVQREYDSTTPHEISSQVDAALADIAAIDERLEALQAERHRLTGRRDEAEHASATVDGIARELHEAKGALSDAQANAFINAEQVDDAPHTACIAKLEKRLSAARKDSESAKAALPAIASRLADLAEQESEDRTARAAAVIDYFELVRRQHEITYRQQVEALVDTVDQIRAYDRLTRNDLGQQLLEGMRNGLRLPLLGKHTKPLSAQRHDREIAALSAAASEQLSALLSARRQG